MNSTQSTNAHPRGLYLLFFTEMWERFSYYGMRAIFILFMTKALLMKGPFASNIYGTFTGLVYLTPLLGGYIADRFWGNRRSILIGGLLMAAGQFLMFISGSWVTDGIQSSASISMMWTALTFLIIGNGFFKPNISTMVGQLYPAGDQRINGAFSIFYMGINLGAFFSPLICGGLGDTGSIHDFRWGFLAACIGMIISVVSFELLKNKYLNTPDGQAVGMPKSKLDTKNLFVILGSTAVIFFLLYFKKIMEYVVSADTLANEQSFIHWIYSVDLTLYLIIIALIIMPMIILTDKSLIKDERQRIMVIFILMVFVIFFWMCFEQAGASLTLFADAQTNRVLHLPFIGAWTMPASWFQSINPLGIVVMAPLFSMFWNYLNKKNIEPSSPMKMAFGLLLLSLGYVVIAYAVHGVSPSVKIGMWWLWALYVLHTMGELCLSPVGLSMVSKLSPIRFSSLLMGTWFLSNAGANKFAGALSALIPPGAGEEASTAATKFPTFLGLFEINNLFTFFCVFVGLSGAASLILFVSYKWLEKRMHGVK